MKANACFVGEPIFMNGKEEKCDTGTLHIFLIFLVFNLIYNQLMLYIFKEGSSVLFVVSSAVCLPLTDILYMVPAIAGPTALQNFTIYDGFALFVLVMGLLVYHSENEDRGGEGTSKSPMFASPSLQRTHLMKRRKGRTVYRQSPTSFRKTSQSPKIRRGLPSYGSTGRGGDIP